MSRRAIIKNNLFYLLPEIALDIPLKTSSFGIVSAEFFYSAAQIYVSELY